MAEISISAWAMVNASPDQVRAAIADYRQVRPEILTPAFTGYEVLEGGQGAGSHVRWTLDPSRSGRRQARAWEVRVEEQDGVLVEHDALSSTVITWTAEAAPDGRCVVKVQLVWDGPGGFSGLVARSKTGKLRGVYGDVLMKLRERFMQDATEPSATEPDGA